MKILLYGYGNPGRQDDGLGIVFIEQIEQWIKDEKITTIETDNNYQLNIEDAEIISHQDFVIFIDASMELIEDFEFTKIDSNDASIEFTMHAVSPSYVLDLCKKIYNKNPQTFLLHIKGYEWELGGEMTGKAKNNLSLAIEFAKKKIKELTGK
jgi:hydrogenase maturation protease